MVRTKREYDGGLVAWHAAALIAFMPFTAKQLDPDAINPYRERDPEAQRKLDEVKKYIAAVGMQVKAREAFAAAGIEV